MKKQSFTKRFVFPVLTVFLVLAVSYTIYHLSPMVGNYTLFQILANISAVFILLSLWFGVLYVYPKAYFRGAGTAERIIASVITPFAWATKEVIVLSGVYSIWESIYFYLNPVTFWVFCTVLAEIGLAEILCRRSLKKRGEKIKVLSIPALVALVLGVGNFLFALLWDVGVHHFYFFQEGYKALFY